jgi:hypothetical protein
MSVVTLHGHVDPGNLENKSRRSCVCARRESLLHADIKDYFTKMIEICNWLLRLQNRDSYIHTAANVCGMSKGVPVEIRFILQIFHPFINA